MNKKFSFAKLFATAAALVCMASVSAKASTPVLGELELQALAQVTPLNLINWKVGDTMSYDVEMGFFGKMGTSVKSVAKEEGGAIWVHQEMNLSGQKELIDMLINRADAKILKVLRNGQEMQMPDDKIEVISQDFAEVTVPAGTFKTVHIVAKSKQVSKIELWANPTDTAMDGGVKQIMATQFGDITMSLTSFKRN